MNFLGIILCISFTWPKPIDWSSLCLSFDNVPQKILTSGSHPAPLIKSNLPIFEIKYKKSQPNTPWIITDILDNLVPDI